VDRIKKPYREAIGEEPERIPSFEYKTECKTRLKENKKKYYERKKEEIIRKNREYYERKKEEINKRRREKYKEENEMMNKKVEWIKAVAESEFYVSHSDGF
jgi:hypothetical protein